jgi:hypothetical protein
MQILASPFKHIRFNITLLILPCPVYETMLQFHECLLAWHERVLKHYQAGRRHISKCVHLLSYNSCSLLKVNMVTRHCVIWRYRCEMSEVINWTRHFVSGLHGRRMCLSRWLRGVRQVVSTARKMGLNSTTCTDVRIHCAFINKT